MKKTLTVQLETPLHNKLTRQAKAAGLKKTDFVRLLIRDEIKEQKLFKKITCFSQD
jgi:hypothetical protein